MGAAASVIPYEKQSDAQTNRGCGAACLSMVYRSLGKEVAQAEIWTAIAKENQFGSIASTTHLMAKDALSRGLSAVAFQARHPLQALRLCLEAGTRAILNQRPTKESPTGHYTVLVGMDERDVVMHDPFYGPSRRVPHAELFGLWQPQFPNSEIAGYVLIAIAAHPPALTPCWLCHAPMPPRVVCPRCQQPVGLQPGAVLGCVTSDCIARMWNYICCPSCDCGFTFSAAGPGATAWRVVHERAESAIPDSLPPGALAAPSTAEHHWNLDPVIAAMDNFITQMLSLPDLASHAGVKQQLDLMKANKETLKLAYTEAFANQAIARERWSKLEQQGKQNEEAHRKKLEELNRPSPPLDGDALGRALLKNLGFIK